MSTTLVDVQIAEDQLIEAALEGNRDAFGELVLMHYQGVINVVYRLGGEMQLAEDVAQETFIRVGSFRSWVYRIATNAALDVFRRRKEEVDIEELPLSSPDSGVEQNLIRRQQAEIVRQAVLDLPLDGTMQMGTGFNLH